MTDNLNEMLIKFVSRHNETCNEHEQRNSFYRVGSAMPLALAYFSELEKFRFFVDLHQVWIGR